LVLDLFMRYESFWTDVVVLREQWGITPETALPPYPPPGDLAALGLLTREQMPERIFLPPIPPSKEIDALRRAKDADTLGLLIETIERGHIRARVTEWLHGLRDLFRAHVPEAARSGDDRQAWMSWMPVLSACATYDPPDTELLAFAEYDDVEAAVLPRMTHWQDPETVQATFLRLAAALRRLEDVPPSREREHAAMVVATLHARDIAATWRESAGVPEPRRGKGRPPIPPLVAAQCAILKDRYGWTYEKVSERMGWEAAPSYDPRGRHNSAIDSVARGRELLESRKYSLE
jgi:hypothetical protein